MLPIDLAAIVAIVMGISVVLVPVIGLTARFALKPIVESLGHFFQSRNTEEAVRILERRMGLLEHHLETIETKLDRLSDAADFHSELRSGPPAHLPATSPAHPKAGSVTPPWDTRP